MVRGSVALILAATLCFGGATAYAGPTSEADTSRPDLSPEAIEKLKLERLAAQVLVLQSVVLLAAQRSDMVYEALLLGALGPDLYSESSRERAAVLFNRGLPEKILPVADLNTSF